MYNVEKYIAATLESLLAQTFQDFEVVVVDNGSTDNSPAILASYVPKFGGRLRTSRIEKNSGGPSPAYNKSVALSRGKYVFVMDSDDLLVNTALAELYELAENFNADVVYMDRGFRFVTETDKPFPAPENLEMHGWQGRGTFVDRPTLETNDMAERVRKFCNSEIGWTAWEKLVLRDLLIENNITFPNLRSSGDIAWTIQVLCCTKNFLRAPKALYIYRQHPTSICNTRRTPREEIDFWLTINANGINFLDEWLSGREFFQQNPQYKWDLLEMFERIHCGNITNATTNFPPQEAYKILEDKFEGLFGEHGKLIAYFCAASNLSQLRWKLAAQRAYELENRLKQLQGG